MKEGIKLIANYVPEEPVKEVKRKHNLEKLARLSANENPYGTSKKVKEALKLAINDENLNRYPDPDASKLRHSICNYFKINENQVVFGVGLDEIIQLISRAFLVPDDEVIVANPTFLEYEIHAKIESAKIKKIKIDAKTGHFDFKQALKSINKRTRLIWLCNPNNPTGVYEEKAKIIEFLNQVPKDVLVLIDEAYIDFVTIDKDASCMNLVNDYMNVAVLRTFSKAYGLANLRVGYAVMNDKIAKIIQKIRLPYNLNTLAQKAALAAFNDQKFIAEITSKNQKERVKWSEFLKKNKIEFYPSQANFIYFSVPNENKIAEVLLENGFQIRKNLQKNWLRITIGTVEDNLKMQEIIEEALK